MNSKTTILYVEDDLYLSYVTKDNLEQKGYKILHCKDGYEALQRFNNNDVDICILDIMLPKLDGFTLAKEIRLLDYEVPIIFLTAKSLKEDKIEGLTLGGDDYITKPFSIEELILKIEIFLKRRKVISKQSNSSAIDIRIGEYLFNYKKLLLQNDQTSIRLTLKEAELIHILYSHRNQILERSFILKNIWGEDDYFKGRSLDVFISRIRKYFSDDGHIELKNIHGVGFEFSVKS